MPERKAQLPCKSGATSDWARRVFWDMVWQRARGTSPPQLGLGPKPEIAAGSRELVERCLDRVQRPNKGLGGERRTWSGLETGAELN